MKKIVMALLPVLMVFILFTGCGGRKFIMSEGEINKLPEIKEQKEVTEYSVIWANFNPVLLMSEGIGARHDLHLEDERIFAGIKVVGDDHRVKLMVIIADSKPMDFSKAKGIVSSRSGKHFYSIDGRDVFSENGYLVPKFSWLSIKPLAEAGIEIEKIQFGSQKDKEIQAILTEIGKSLDGRKIPGLFDKIMSRVAKISTQDIFIAGATNFTSLFAIFGVRIWAIVDAVIQKADLSLPYYDTALVDRFQLGLALEPIQKKLNSMEIDKNASPRIQEWEKEMREYQNRKANYQLDRQNWLKEKAKYEQ
ncbi:MAG: hypothetical protein ABIG88_03710 [Patescibacteria group bacterium]